MSARKPQVGCGDDAGIAMTSGVGSVQRMRLRMRLSGEALVRFLDAMLVARWQDAAKNTTPSSPSSVVSLSRVA